MHEKTQTHYKQSRAYVEGRGGGQGEGDHVETGCGGPLHYNTWISQPTEHINTESADFKTGQAVPRQRAAGQQRLPQVAPPPCWPSLAYHTREPAL